MKVLSQKKNRLTGSINLLLTKKMKIQSNIRKSHTRTKIQLGGLLIKSGLTDFLNITQGDDLQLDLEKKDKAYILLGLLTDLYENIQSQDSLSFFLSKGKKIVNSQYKKSCQSK